MILTGAFLADAAAAVDNKLNVQGRATLQVVATATVAAYASLGGLGGYLIDGIKERRFHIALVGAMMVAALALTLDGLLALAGWVSVPGTGRMRKLAAVVDKPAAGGGHALR